MTYVHIEMLEIFKWQLGLYIWVTVNKIKDITDEMASSHNDSLVLCRMLSYDKNINMSGNFKSRSFCCIDPYLFFFIPTGTASSSLGSLRRRLWLPSFHTAQAWTLPSECTLWSESSTQTEPSCPPFQDNFVGSNNHAERFLFHCWLLLISHFVCLFSLCEDLAEHKATFVKVWKAFFLQICRHLWLLDPSGGFSYIT